MLELEIDGKALQVADGSTVIEAAHQAGVYIPRFCYHKKLSVAASCRMCLVQVEKAPKPLPACATPVTNGMKVFTHSEMAVKAQKGVMEFLLINHPLDCPICDQGGECRLQDLSVGYGGGQSRYQEAKRVVVNKNYGPLISTEMTRCINCTRCVRFTQEIAGRMELGQAFRGERAEIMPFLEQTIESELSGNIIDLCPVGALTSKPFRFSARAWELARRKSVSPHDALGSNLMVQVKHDRVYRVLPLENEELNECWLSDKDRFSYEGLNSPERLTKPMIKQGGVWKEVEWNQALDYAAHALRDVAKEHGAAAIGALVSPHATLEEMYLSGKLMRGLGSQNIDFRLRQSDFSGQRAGTPWLGMRVADINQLDRVLLVGAFLRKDQPLIAQRLRQAVKRGAQVSVIHSADDDLMMPLTGKLMAAPSQLPERLAQVVKAVAELKGAACDLNAAVSPEAKKIAESLASGQNTAVLLGNFAQQHAQAATLNRFAQQLAELLGCRFGFLGEAANSVGGYVAKALPEQGGLDAARMMAAPRKAYLVVGAEPELDCADGAQALAAFKQAASVIVLSPFKSTAALEYADAILPIAPFTETSGTFINAEARVQSFQAVNRPLGETRPGWKVLRVLANVLKLDGFDFASSEAVREEALAGNVPASLNNGISDVAVQLAASDGVERVADVPAYFADPLVRRAAALQRTRDAAAPVAYMNAATLAALRVTAGNPVKVSRGDASIVLPAALDAGLADNCVRIAAGHAATINLGAMNGVLRVEPA
ncbi:MAG: NADH-quinone oxidoreductase subunit NuoG [Zoogloeaceae bacterium]|jgi:NADH-quinone oxidoreductase subunit G|nr:NADH-quinone oxidoreductase subunit NuoG [Zoogloeaceae bacterium]